MYARAGYGLDFLQVIRPHFNIHVKIGLRRLGMKMSSFMYERACAMPRTLYLSCGILFPVWTPDNISGLTSVVVLLAR